MQADAKYFPPIYTLWESSLMKVLTKDIFMESKVFLDFRVLFCFG